MLRLPRKWVMLAGLLAAFPSVTLAGPFSSDSFAATSSSC